MVIQNRKSISRRNFVKLSGGLAVSSLLAACAPTSVQPAAAPKAIATATVAATEAAPTAVVKTTPTFSIVIPALHKDTPDGSYIEQKLNEAAGVKAQVIRIPWPGSDEERTKTALLMSDSSTMPDVHYLTDKSLKEYGQWRDAGLLVDIAPLIKKGVANNILKYYMDMGQKDTLFAMYEDGKVYHLVLDTGEPGTVSGFVRKAWMEKFGISKIETLDQYEDYLIKCTKNDPLGAGKNDTYGLSGDKNDLLQLYTFFAAHKVDPFNWMVGDDGTIKWGPVLRPAKDALSRLAKLYGQGVIDPNLVTGGKSFWDDLFENGKIGSFYYYIWMWSGSCQQYKRFLQKNPGDDYLRLVPPKGPDGFASDKPSDLNGSMYYVWTTKNKEVEASLRYVDTLVKPEINVLGLFGEEGVDYKINADGGFETLKPIEELDKRGIRFKGYIIERKDKWNLEAGKIAASYWSDASLNTSVPMRKNLYFPREKTRPIWTKVGGDLMTLRDTYFWGIISGAKPVDAWDEFVTKWYAAGGADAEKEINEYYKQDSEKRKEFDAFYEKEWAPLIA